METLKLRYITSYGSVRIMEYTNISKFLSDFENGEIDTDGSIVQAIFSKRKGNIQNFNTMHELYEFLANPNNKY